MTIFMTTPTQAENDVEFKSMPYTLHYAGDCDGSEFRGKAHFTTLEQAMDWCDMYAHTMLSIELHRLGLPFMALLDGRWVNIEDEPVPEGR